jgi:xylitol oxidase
LDLQPAYDMQQYVYDNLPAEELAAHFDEVFATGYSVSAFTDWSGPVINQVWLKRRVDRPDGWTAESRWLGASLADGPRHPVPGMPAVNCTEQLGVPGPWNERLPTFRLEFTPSSGDELQSEYVLPREHAVSALDALDRLSHQIAPVLQIAEVRTIASDELWMSSSYRRESVGLHFTWIDDVNRVTPVVTALEAAIAPFEARPHWGKLFCTSSEVVRGLYERLPDFQRLVGHYDPAGKFRNEFLDQYLLDEARKG